MNVNFCTSKAISREMWNFPYALEDRLTKSRFVIRKSKSDVLTFLLEGTKFAWNWAEDKTITLSELLDAKVLKSVLDNIDEEVPLTNRYEKYKYVNLEQLPDFFYGSRIPREVTRDSYLTDALQATCDCSDAEIAKYSPGDVCTLCFATLPNSGAEKPRAVHGFCRASVSMLCFGLRRCTSKTNRLTRNDFTSDIHS
jgi:hypothetical protein